ncbi:MAG: T9SS type A sorting domain-containing protein [Saprospiraceae bacterium]|nr:T9SS type A sorting domain-containing protein [Saprospiraceae bacterium]
MKKTVLFILALFSVTALFSQAVIFQENFDTIPYGSHVTSSSTGTTSWGITTQLAVSGTRADSACVALSDSLYLTSNTFSTTGNTSVYLEFDQICKIEFFDAAFIEVSNNNGTSWTRVTSGYNGLGAFNSIGYKFASTSYSLWVPGTNSAVPTNSWWKHETFDLSTYISNAAQVKIRFVLGDANNTGAVGTYGWLLDNIKVTASFSELIPPALTLIPPIVQDTVYSTGPYEIKTKITDASGIDTAMLIYTVSTGFKDTIGMSILTPDTFAANIPFFGFGKTIQYYVKAIDASAAHNMDSTATKSFYCKYSSGGTFTVGTGTVVNTSTGYPAPYGNYWWGSKHQMLITAAEMAAINMTGGQIESLAFDVSAVNTCPALQNFEIKIKSTNLSAITTTWESGLTTVYTNTAYQPVTGWNTHQFQTPFNWDGVSNLIIETCFNNSSYLQNASMVQSATTYPSTHYVYGDVATNCTAPGLGQTANQRPNMQFVVSGVLSLDLDIGAYQITNPTGGVLANQDFEVKFNIKNYGNDSVVKATVNWELDNVLQAPYTFLATNYDTLWKDSVTADIILDTLNLGVGAHSLKIWTVDPNDTADYNSGNDTAYVSFYACSSLLSGNYTIGGTNPDFANFSAAALGLDQCGISGPVTFTVASGTYNEQIELPFVSGSSATNTITFKSASGDSTDVILTNNASPASGNYTLKLNGTSNISFMDMTFAATDSLLSKVIEIGNSAENVHFLNNRIIGMSTSITDEDAALIYTSDSIGNNITILNNRFEYGSIAIELSGKSTCSTKATGVQINNNILMNHLASGIIMTNLFSPQVKENLIETNSNHNAYTGIAGNSLSGSPLIVKNNIKATNTQIAYGIRMSQCDICMSSTNSGLVANNFILINGLSTATTITAGILNNESKNINYYYNTINITGNQTNAVSMCLFDATAGLSDNINIVNNIFSNEANGYTYYVTGVDTSKFFVDYNDIYNPGTGTFAYLGAAVTDLATWKTKTAEETHSITINPYFSSAIDLHTTNNLLNGTAIPIAGVIDDIDGDLRNATTPDIGADEFAPSPYDIATLEILTPIDGCGLDTNEVVTIRIKNLGSATVNGGFTASYKINNNLTVTESVSSTILTGDTLDYSFTTTANLDVFALMIDSTYEFKAWVDLSTDPVHYNDTAYLSVFSGYLPPSPVTTDTSINYGDSVTLTAQHVDSVFYWYQYDTSSVALHTGEFYNTPVLYDTTTYWVAVGGSASADSLTTTFVDNNGSAGNMFDITAFTTITIDSFYMNGTSSALVEVWYRPGTYIGHTSSNVGWTQLGSYNVISAGQGNPTRLPVGGLTIPAGQTYGIHISYVSGSIRYTNGTGTNEIYQDANMKFEGYHGGSYFNQTNTPRVWNGRIFYSQGGGSCESNRVPLNVNVINIPTVELGISAITTNSGCNMSNTEQVTIDIYNQGFVAATDSIFVSYKIDNNSYITQEIVPDTIAPGDTVSYTFSTTANLSTMLNDTTYTITAYVAHPQDVYAINDTLVSGLIEALYTPPAPIVSDTVIPYGSIVTLTGISNDTLYWYNTPVDTNYIYMGSYFTTPILYDTTTYYVESKAGSSGSYTIGTGTVTNTSTGYPTPYGNYYYGSKNQFLILASELSAMGMTAGDVKSVAFDVSNVNACPGLTNYEIKLKNTSLTALTTTWESGMTSVYLNPSYQPVTGWNTHTFTTSFNWDGTSNLIIETCFNNTSYPSNGNASVNQTSTSFAATHEYHTDNSTVCSAPAAGSTFNQRPNMVLYAASSGCPSTRVPLTVNVTAPPQFDAGIKSIHTPVTDFDLTSNETVQVMVMNTGTDSIYNFPLAYKIDNLPPVVDTFTNVLYSGDSALFTFAVPANMSVYKIYNVKAYTMLPLDSTFMNDTSITQVENKMIVYCTCSATSGSYEDLTNVTIANLNNTSTVPAAGTMYSDFTSLPPAILSPGQTYNVSITSDYAVYTSSYSCWVNVFIDYNHDGIYSPTTEIAFSSATSSSNTVTGTITVPQTASTGVATGIRVAFRESGTQANTGPCGTFTWGEVEDYMAFIMPLIPNDAGVTEIISPGTITNEAASTPVQVVVKNYGTDTITSMNVDYMVNGGTAVTTAYTGTLAPSNSDTIILTPMISPAGNSTICAYTVLTGDTNTFNDNKCKSFFGIPLKDAYVTRIEDIKEGCGLGFDTVMIWIKNIGVDTINGSVIDTITAHYQLDGISTIVNENMTLTINPGDSALFVFNTLANFAVTTTDSIFDVVAWVNLTGDNVSYNDTAYTDVESLHIPAPPTVTSPVTVPYATSAILSASSPDQLTWFADDTTSIILDTGANYTTSLMYLADTFYVQAGQVNTGTGNVNIAPLAVASASPACNTGACSTLNDLNFGTCGSQQMWITSSASNPGSSVNVTFIWPTAKSFNKMTIHVGSSTTRFLTGGTIQIWNGSAWVNHHTFTQATGVCFYDITFPIATSSRVRIIDMTVGGSQSSNVNFREIEIFEALVGCSSIRVPVIVNVSAPSSCDVGVFEISQPVSAINLTSSENVQVKIKNYGTASQSNFTVSYQVNNNPVVTDTITSILLSNTSLIHTFSTPANLGIVGQTYNLKAYTSLTCDSTHQNDTTWKSVQNKLPNYCISTATSTADDDIGKVTFAGINNTSPTPYNAMYTDYTNTTPAMIAPTTSYPISIDIVFSGSSYSGYCEVYIDYNRDGVFTEPAEIAFGGAYTGLQTLTGTVNVPLSALNGLTVMRVVAVESGSATSVTPCGTYTWGETEDYSVMIAPLIAHDAGVVDILKPKTIATNPSTQVQAIIMNYGTDPITSVPVSYVLNTNTPVTITWTGSLLTGDSATVTFPTITLPTGQNTICVYTSLPLDSNTFNDQKCITSFVQLITTAPYFDNFEGTDFWLNDTLVNQWERGIPSATVITSAHSPNNVWMIDLDSNYAHSSFDYLYSPKFDFMAVQPDSLKFWHYYNTQANGDGGRLQYKTTTGGWLNMGDENDTNGVNWYNNTYGGVPTWDGNSNGWVKSSYKLSAITNFANPAQFRFVFQSDATINNFDGWAIDDFEITTPMMPNDPGVTTIITPANTTQIGSPVTVSITIKNYGLNALSTIPVHYKVGNLATVNATWTGSLLPGATANYTFATTYTSPSNNYSLCAWTTGVNPTYTYNDTICKNINVTAAAYDVGVCKIVSPIDTLKCKVIVWIKNYGVNVVTSTDVFYHLNGMNKKTQTWTGTLNPNDSVLFTFINANPPLGSFGFCAGTKLSGDMNHSNDSLCKSIIGGVCDPYGLYEIENGEFILGQNIPNPTTGITRITYIVPISGTMRFDLINVLGQTMQTQEQTVMAGQHSIELFVGDLPAGVYYYSVLFEGKRLVKKMVISK